jgi:hypothetical protein
LVIHSPQCVGGMLGASVTRTVPTIEIRLE